MTRWEYAMLSDPDSGTDAITFSHPQGEDLVKEWSGQLTRGLKAENSNRSFLHLNFSHVTRLRVCGMLGDRGWELAGFSTLTGGHAYWMFKRQLAE